MSCRAVLTLALLGMAGMANGQSAREHHSPTQHEQHEQHGQPATAPASPGHVPPDPPAHPMPPMSNQEMADIMKMDDAAPYGAVLVDRLEWRERGDALAWDGTARYGGDYHKLLLKSEGEYADDELEHARTEVLWDRAFSRWWHLQAGLRQDSGAGPSRTWAALGLAGLAPYWFEVEATFYVGEQGRTALRLEGEYDFRLTQRLLLQPQLELDFRGKDDPALGLGSGLSELEAGLRLRYEIRRELAPYVGVQWVRLFAATADLARQAGRDRSTTQFVAGLRVRF